MANEAVIVELLGNRGEVVDYTVADAAAIEKGAVLRLTDARTASGANIVNGAVAGIAAAEKVASDGQVNIGCYTYGIFDMRASGAITIGAPIGVAENNDVMAVDVTKLSGAHVIGHALETATNAEVIEIKVNI